MKNIQNAFKLIVLYVKIDQFVILVIIKYLFANKILLKIIFLLTLHRFYYQNVNKRIANINKIKSISSSTNVKLRADCCSPSNFAIGSNFFALSESACISRNTFVP